VRGEFIKGPERNIVFRTPNPPKTKVVNVEALNSNSARLTFKQYDPMKPKLPVTIPTKTLSAVAIKPGIFNEGVMNKASTGSTPQLVPFRSRKEQFIIQGNTDPYNNNNNLNTNNTDHGNHGILKRNLQGPEGYGDNPQPQITTFTEKEAEFVRPGSKRTEIKLPKLEPLIGAAKKASDNETGNNNNNNNLLHANMNYGNHNNASPSPNPNFHLNMNNNLGNNVNYHHNFGLPSQAQTAKEITEGETSPYLGPGKPPRKPLKSFDQFAAKNKVELMDPRQLLNQPQILSRRKPSESSLNSVSKLFGNNNDNHHHDRSPTPVRTRAPSISGGNALKSQIYIPPIQQEVPKEVKIVSNFSFKSKAGALPGKPIKTNQDSYIVHTNFAGHKDKFLFGVCDGHGVNGHLASNFIKQQLPKNIEMQYKNLPNEEPQHLKEALTTAFLKTNRELFDSSIDCNFSGSTTVTVLLFNTRLWCANVGDSRAIIGKLKNNSWVPLALSRDHKPDLPEEKKRIIASGGRVDTFRDPYGHQVGPYRVWLKDENVPGLAMSRSLGDGVAASAGCIPEPEILQFDLEEEDKFMVIASDGVWEFLSNQQIIDMVVPFYIKNNLESACDKLVRESTLCWKAEDDVVDDITCVVISLKVPPKPKNEL